MSLRLILGYRKDPNFERQLVQDVKKAGRRGGDAMSNEFVRTAKNAGDKSAKEIIRDLNAQFRLAKGRLDFNLAKGVIDEAEFKRRIRNVRREMVQGLGAAHKRLQKESRLTAADHARLGSKMATLERQIRRAGNTASRAGRQFGGMGTRLRTMAAGIVGTAGLVAAFRAGVGEAAKFETAVAQVDTIAGVTAERMEFLTRQVSHLATTMPKSREDLGFGLYQVFSAGVTDSAEAMRVLGVATRLAVGGMVETGAAVQTVTGIMNAYNLTADQAGDVSDILFQTVRLGVTTIPELAGSLGQVIPTASQAGVAVHELGAAIATLTKANIPTAIATTALNSMLASLIKPGDEATQTAKALGIEWNLSAMQAMGFADFMAHVTEAAGGNVEVLAKLSGSMRSARALMVLAGKGADNFQIALEGMETRTGSTNDAAAKMNATLESQAQLLKNRAADAWGSFAEAVARAGVALGNLVFPDDEKLARLAAMGSTAPAVERWRERQTAAFLGRRHRPAGFAGDDAVADARRRIAEREADAAIATAAAQAVAEEQAEELASQLKAVGQELAALLDKVDPAVVEEWSENLAGAAQRILDARAALAEAVKTGDPAVIAAAAAELGEAEAHAAALVELMQAVPDGVVAPLMGQLITEKIPLLERGTENVGKNWKEIADAVSGTAKGLLSVLDGAGKLSDELRVVLRGVIDISDAWGSISQMRAEGTFSLGAAIGPVAAGIGAVVGIASALFGRDDEKKRREERQIRAMKDLRDSLDDLRSAVQEDFAPGAVGPAVDRVRGLVRDAQTADPRDRQTAREDRDAAVRDLLKMLGMDESSVFDGRTLNLARLTELLDSLGDLNFGAFGEDFEGRIDALNFALGHIGDAAGGAEEQLARFLKVLEDFSPAAAAQLREALKRSPEDARKLFAEWAEILAAGGGPLEALLTTLGLSASDLRLLIEQGSRFAGGEGGAGISRSVQIQQSITEIQAVAVIAWLQDIAITLRQIHAFITGTENVAAVAARGVALAASAPAVAGVASRDATQAAGSAVTVINHFGPFTIDNPHITPEHLRDLEENIAEKMIRAAGWRSRGEYF